MNGYVDDNVVDDEVESRGGPVRDTRDTYSSASSCSIENKLHTCWIEILPGDLQ